MHRVLEINDIDALAAYRPLWSHLLPQTPGASFFHSLEWLAMYWRYYGRGQRLRVLIVCEADGPIGILPLVVRGEPTRLGTVRVLTYPLHDWGTFYGPIGPRPAETLLAGLRHIRRTRREWDMLDLRWVDRDGFDQGQTALALQQCDVPFRADTWFSSPQIDLSGAWDKYWASRTSRWRNNVRRSEKRLACQGALSYVRYRPEGAGQGVGDPRWDLYDACEQIAARSWQADSQSGTTLTHPSVRQFLRRTHCVACQAGTAEINLLLLEGAPVAFNYAYHYQGNVFGLRTGFDRGLADQGAGSVLQMFMIRDSFERGDRSYDLGPGYLQCKRYWQTRLATSCRYTHVPPTPSRVQLLRVKRWLRGWIGKAEGEARKGEKAST